MICPDTLDDLAMRCAVLEALQDGAWRTAAEIALAVSAQRHVVLLTLREMLAERTVRRARVDQTGPFRWQAVAAAAAKRRLRMVVGDEPLLNREPHRLDCVHEDECTREVARSAPDAEWCECPADCSYYEKVPQHVRLALSNPQRQSAIAARSEHMNTEDLDSRGEARRRRGKKESET